MLNSVEETSPALAVAQQASSPELNAAQLELPVTVIQPRKGWQLIDAKELWQYRELLFIFTWRDVKVRYKQTLLGAAWAIIQPFMMMLVFTVFLGKMAGVNSG